MLYLDNKGRLGLPLVSNPVDVGITHGTPIEIYNSSGQLIDTNILVSESTASPPSILILHANYPNYIKPPTGEYFQYNQFIPQGSYIQIKNTTTQINIEGPWVTFINPAEAGSPQRVGKYFTEPNYIKDRHDLFNVNGITAFAPEDVGLINPNALLGSSYSPMIVDYSSICYVGTPTLPGGQWNASGNKLGMVLTKRHILYNGHYPIYGSAILVGTTLQNNTIRKPAYTGSTEQPLISGSSFMVISDYINWWNARHPGQDWKIINGVPSTWETRFHDLVIQTLHTTLPDYVSRIQIPILRLEDYSRSVIDESPNIAVQINNTFGKIGTMINIPDHLSLSFGTYRTTHINNIPDETVTIPPGLSQGDSLYHSVIGDSGSIFIGVSGEKLFFKGLIGTNSDNLKVFNTDVTTGVFAGCVRGCETDVVCDNAESCRWDSIDPNPLYKSETVTCRNVYGSYYDMKLINAILADTSWQINTNQPYTILEGDLTDGYTADFLLLSSDIDIFSNDTFTPCVEVTESNPFSTNCMPLSNSTYYGRNSTNVEVGSVTTSIYKESFDYVNYVYHGFFGGIAIQGSELNEMQETAAVQSTLYNMFTRYWGTTAEQLPSNKKVIPFNDSYVIPDEWGIDADVLPGWYLYTNPSGFKYFIVLPHQHLHLLGGDVFIDTSTRWVSSLDNPSLIENAGADFVSIIPAHRYQVYLNTKESPTGPKEPPLTYNIYVNGTIGNDAWTGRASTTPASGVIGPVRTIARATLLARQYISDDGDLDVEIKIAGGTYRILGTDANPILYMNSTYSPRPGRTLTFKPLTTADEVIISGSDEIPFTSFTKITSSDPLWDRLPAAAQQQVYVADLSSFDIGLGYPSNWNGQSVGSAAGVVRGTPTVPDLIFNDVVMTVARWPNKSTLTSSGVAMGESAFIHHVVDSGTNGTWEVNRSFLGWKDLAGDPCCTTTSPCEQTADNGESGVPSCFRDGIFAYDPSIDARIASWSDSLSTGIFIKGWWRWDWDNASFKVMDIASGADNGYHMTVRSRNSAYGIQNFVYCNPSNGQWTGTPDNSYAADPTPRRWYAFNLIEELDLAGEYYISRSNSRLYFWPPNNIIDSTSNIRLTHRAVAGAGINVDTSEEVGFNASGEIDRSNYAYPGWTDEAVHGWSTQGTEMQTRTIKNTKYSLSSLFKLKNVRNVIIQDLTFRDSAGSGIELFHCENTKILRCKIYNIKRIGINAPGGRYVTIDGCDIHDIGANAIINTGGNRQTLEPANKVVTKCSIRRWDRDENANTSAAIVVDGVGNTISYNLVSTGSTAIKLLYANDITIKYNHFHNIAKHHDDWGGLYVGRNSSSMNIIIENNFFNEIGSDLPGGPNFSASQSPYGGNSDCPGDTDHNTIHGSHTIYIDDRVCGMVIRNNVFFKCGTRAKSDAIFYHSGIKNEATNNIFVDCHTVFTEQIGTVAQFNAALAGQEFMVLNTEAYPWYESGGPGNDSLDDSTTAVTGYSPWSWYLAPNAWPSPRHSGIMNVVDIRANEYRAAYPWLNSLYQFTDQQPGTPSNITLHPVNMNIHRNTQTDNVFVDCINKYVKFYNQVPETETYIPLALVDGEYTWDPNSQELFENRAANDFKLTIAGLARIQVVLPNFQDIPFNSIPTLGN